MLDALKELEELSEALQRNDITVVRASQLIIRQIRVFRKRKMECMLPRPAKLLQAERSKTLLCDLHQKMLSLSTRISFLSHWPATWRNDCYQKNDMELVNKFKVLDPDVWPDGDGGVDMAQYDEQEIADLCANFRLPATPVRQSFRNFRDSGGKKIPNELKPQ